MAAPTSWSTNNPYRQFQQSPVSAPALPSKHDRTPLKSSSTPPTDGIVVAAGSPPRLPSTATTKHSPAPPSPPPEASTYALPPNHKEAIRTRSISGPFCSAGIIFERKIDLSPPNDDEIIIATIKYSPQFRRSSLQENAPLPSRPRARGFLRRMSTRWNAEGADGGNGAGQERSGEGYKMTAMKMPRREYKKFFARDREGRYVGTEVPERQWSLEELEERYAKFQELPLRSVPGAQEFGEDYTGEEAQRRPSATKECGP